MPSPGPSLGDDGPGRSPACQSTMRHLFSEVKKIPSTWLRTGKKTIKQGIKKTKKQRSKKTIMVYHEVTQSVYFMVPKRGLEPP